MLPTQLFLKSILQYSQVVNCVELQQKLQSMCSCLRIESYEHGVWHIAFSQPEFKNALSLQMRAELSTVLTHLNAIPYEDEFRLLVFSGDGTVFSAGANLNDMKNSASYSQSQNLEDARALGRMFYQLANCSVPTISVVQGAAFGGGFGLAACTDFVLAEETTKFCLSEVSIGLVPGVISPYVVRKIGHNFATKVMLTARKFSGIEMREMGMVEECYGAQSAAENPEQALKKLLKELLQNGANALRRTKLLLKKATPLPGTDVFEFSVQNIAQARSGAEGKEGLAAVLEKRKPTWGVFL
jgi:methylglutaconyl-CoA hydratase